MFQHLIEYIISAFKSNWKAVVIGSLITCITIWALLVYGTNMTLRSLKVFIIDQQQERETLSTQLSQINKLIEDAEDASHQNQQEIINLVQRHHKSGDDSEFGMLLSLSSKSQDIIRALITFGGIYATLVSSDTYDESSHTHLSNLYSAVLEITLDNPLETNEFNDKERRNAAKKDRKSLCDISEFKGEHICRAKKLLENVERNIGDFPVEFRYDVEIEVLRYLSYCAARSLETKNQEIYTEKAEDILKVESKRTVHIPEEDYRRRFYWIDYSRLLSVVGEQKPGFKKEANKYFKKLRKGLGTQSEFLRRKLIQHKGLMKDGDQEDSDCKTSQYGTRQKTWCALIQQANKISSNDSANQ